MVEEQVRPLAPAIERPINDEGDTTQQHIQSPRNFIKRCAYPLAFLLLLAIIVIIILILTVFRVKDPIITMDGVKITKLELVNSLTPTNMSLIAYVSVKNPNVASFKYSNTTTSLYYHGIMMGEARGPPGRAKARRTIRMNVTIEVATDRILFSPDFSTDLVSGLLTVSSFSRVPGQVNIFNLFKRHVVVSMNCTTTFNISTQAIQEQTCKRKVQL
ncbi:hypothetical protein RJT34_15588 [Clitoria ternatea]|uniref:Late embryogenesis abundant protein LEA-2 subgroup domain-containing protein n=1 Tax=Clitoria ternatea TaxID=43366 RepID=A0AAN9J6X1_CLITE